MSLSEALVKFIGMVLALVGFALLLAIVGVHILGIGFEPVWAEAIVGVLFLAAGIYIIRGGTITL